MTALAIDVLLTIDPSTTATGWAVTELCQGSPPRLTLARAGHPARGVLMLDGITWVSRCGATRAELETIVRKFHPDRIICEIPETWKTMTGRGAALGGSLLRLGFVSGCMMGISSHAITQYVSANEWKGQTPKSLTRERVRDFFGHDEPNEHIADALGIARWFYREKARGGFGGAKK